MWLGIYRGVAQLVARTAGGREVAGSSPVTPTKLWVVISLTILERLVKIKYCLVFYTGEVTMTTWDKSPGGFSHGTATAIHEY